MVDQTSTSIFEAPPETPEDTTPAQSADPVATLLAGILAEDGRQKYATVEEAIKSVGHSQEHIRRLEQEAAALNEEVARRKSAEEVLTELQATKSSETTPSPELDYSQIEQFIDRKLTATEQSKVASGNTAKVIEAMTGKFGDKAEEVFLKTAQDSGISINQLNALAASSPLAVLKLAGVDQAVFSNTARSTGSVNPGSLTPSTQQPNLVVPAGASKDIYMAAWRAAGQT
jgi:hypothetical protein